MTKITSHLQKQRLERRFYRAFAAGKRLLSPSRMPSQATDGASTAAMHRLSSLGGGGLCDVGVPLPRPAKGTLRKSHLPPWQLKCLSTQKKCRFSAARKALLMRKSGTLHQAACHVRLSELTCLRVIPARDTCPWSCISRCWRRWLSAVPRDAP